MLCYTHCCCLFTRATITVRAICTSQRLAVLECTRLAGSFTFAALSDCSALGATSSGLQYLFFGPMLIALHLAECNKTSRLPRWRFNHRNPGAHIFYYISSCPCTDLPAQRTWWRRSRVLFPFLLPLLHGFRNRTICSEF
jgi:hypothetical protein